jgi:hypothetical protein
VTGDEVTGDEVTGDEVTGDEVIGARLAPLLLGYERLLIWNRII